MITMKTIKHLWSIFIAALLCISCTEDVLPIAVEGLELNLTTLSMKVGESKTLTATITPADAENQAVKWSSSNKSVASVEDGEITAHKAGETTISVTSEDGGFRASCTVTVTEEQNLDDGNNNDSGNEDDGNQDDGNGDDGNHDGNDDGQTGEDDGTEIKVGTATLALGDITATTATFTGSASAVSPDFEVGIYYSLNPKVQVQTAEKVSTYNLSSSNGFTLSLNGLQFDATYYYCVFVHMNGVDVYSDIRSFKTGKVVAGVDNVEVQIMNVVFSGTLERHNRDASVVAYVEYGTDPQLANGTIKQHLSPAQDGKWAFTVTGLPITPTEYYYRTYIYQQSHNKKECGEIKSFTTAQADISISAQSVTQTTATLAGTVKSPDNSSFEFGVLYSTGSNLDPWSSEVKKQTIATDNDGNYSLKIENLPQNTTYNYCWYAYKDGKYNCGASTSFSTQPIEVDVDLGAVTQTTATFSVATLLSEPESIDEVGVLYYTEPSFTATTNGVGKVECPLGGSVNYTLTVEGLIFDTMYYCRTFVLQDGKYTYGDIAEFKTQSVYVNLGLDNITFSTATFGGMVKLTENEVIEVGILYSTDADFLSSASSASRLQCTEVNSLGYTSLTAEGLGRQYFKTKYYYCHYIKQGDKKEVYGNVETFVVSECNDWSDFIDLSSSESANCYIVSQSGLYKIRAVKGNSGTAVGAVSSAEVLWETFGTSTSPQVGDLISGADAKGEYIGFQIPVPYLEGNAVIAAKDASGTILWSWHIWLTDQPDEQVYYNDAGTMMDRNLGATSATKGDVGALGLLYQWGRKDPFLSSSSISESTEAKSTITWPSAVKTNSSNGTIEYATAHPTTFMIGNNKNNDWYYTGSSATDNLRWTESSSSKSIYDPCPAGWRVPDGGIKGVWSKAMGSSSYYGTYDSINKGMNFSGKFGSAVIWYPASGGRNDSGDVGLDNVGSCGYCWSASPRGSNREDAYYLGIYKSGYVYPSDGDGQRGCGFSVRCLQVIDEVAGANAEESK